MYNLEKDIEKALRKYPGLYIDSLSETLFIRGDFIAYDKKSNTEIETYVVMISFPESYPYRFPIVQEIGGKIPKDINRHVTGSGGLCFANPQDELMLCRNGITLLWFLEVVLNPHLCREYIREKTGKYPTGERSHGNEGIWEGYYEVFNTSDKLTILEELNQILSHHSIGRNAACYCGSGKKYKTCHEKIEPRVLGIGRNNVISLYEQLKKDYNTKNEIFK